MSFQFTPILCCACVMLQGLASVSADLPEGFLETLLADAKVGETNASICYTHRQTRREKKAFCCHTHPKPHSNDKPSWSPKRDPKTLTWAWLFPNIYSYPIADGQEREWPLAASDIAQLTKGLATYRHHPGEEMMQVWIDRHRCKYESISMYLDNHVYMLRLSW